jgi:hypothetical protein
LAHAGRFHKRKIRPDPAGLIRTELLKRHNDEVCRATSGRLVYKRG